MEPCSPIKDLLYKYSPSKIRNKPLPPPPLQNADTPKKDTRQTSGNMQHKRSIDKFRSLLKQRQHKSSQPPQRPQSREQLDPRILAKRSPNPIRTKRSGSVDLENLSKKVSRLESQLKEARRDLDRALTPVPFGDVETEEALPHSGLIHNGRQDYDGLVEHLLRQRDETYKALKSQSSTNIPSSCKTQERDGTYDNEPLATHELQHKRKRSELREASWKQIQQHVEAESRLRSSSADHLKLHHTHSIDDESPPQRRRKQTHYSNPSTYDTGDELTAVSFERGGADRKQTRPFSAPIEVEANRTQKVRSSRPSLPHQRSVSSGHTVKKVEPQQRRHSHYVSREDYEAGLDRKAKADEAAIFGADEETAQPNTCPRPPSPSRRLVPSPTRLRPVREEYEWDEDIF